MSETKFYTTEEIKEMLKSNDVAVKRAVIAIWKRQTSSERLTQHTAEHNQVGFNAYDAPFLSSLAEQAEAGRTWSAKQYNAARKAIIKYARQLTDIANEKNGVAQSKVECYITDITDQTPDNYWKFDNGEKINPWYFTTKRDAEGDITSWEYLDTINNIRYIVVND